ncbi:flagellar biosynthetic protein FliO [Nibricoccus sp. IMCC34717]|uniref:flagellar biosynthetic protein FliO n=1 Tax=Nibricoccus sp. IMCC34717 TaxID=3034021 RepID=UPI003850DC9D
MPPFASPFTSVTRWLLVVVGCAVLATAQPMSAADEPAAPLKENTIIYPKNAQAPAGAARSDEARGPSWLALAAVLLAGAGAWVLWQKKRGTGPLGQMTHKLSVEETKSLGNRQYLVVARYEDQRFLLGITPGQIQLISKLEAAAKEPRA